MMKKLFSISIFVLSLAVFFEAQAKTETLSLEGDHGKLATVIQTPDGAKKYPLVMILHGLNSQKEMPLLVQIANNLEQAGIASVRFDFNGHGQSEGKFEDMTVLNELEDAKKVYQYVSGLPEVESVSLTGHSQGGVVAGMLAGKLGEAKIKSIALMAPAGCLRDNAEKGDFFGIKYDVSDLPQYIPLFDGHIIGKNYLKTAKTLPIYETSAKYKGPVYILHSKNDEIVPYEYGVRYEKIYENCHLDSPEGFDHNFTQDTAKAAKMISDYFVEVLQK